MPHVLNPQSLQEIYAYILEVDLGSSATDEITLGKLLLEIGAALSAGGHGGTTPTGPAGGDLASTYPNPTVDGLQGRAVAATAPLTNQVLSWNGTTWTPATPASGGGGPPSGPAAGDLGATYPGPTVIGLQGKPIAGTTPGSAQVLTWTGSAWTPVTPANSLPPNGAAGGDLASTYPNPTVVGLQGRPLTSTLPSTNQVIAWNGSAWAPATPAAGGGPPTGAAGGDLGSTYPNPSVVQLQGRPLAATAPSTNQVIVWNGATWTPAAVPVSNISVVTTTFTTNAYTLALGDANTAQQASNGATAGTITVPLNATVGFAVSTMLTFTQTGAGKIQLAAAGGVTIRSSVSGGFVSGTTGCRAQYSTISLLKTATDTWVLAGDAA